MRFFSLFAVILMGWGISRAAPAADTLDQKKVQSEYSDGNFENVIQMLEDYRGKHAAFRVIDSFFVAKYLGVVYTSNPNTREKGKYWLYRMLQLDPSAELVDMYVGEEVDHTFEKVRQEFIVRRNYRGINDVKLAKSIKEGDGHKDTLVVRDTVQLQQPVEAPLPERKLADFRYGWTWNMNVGVGMKFLNKEDWAYTGDQKEFRAAFDIRQRIWPINVAFDFMHSASSQATFTSEGTDQAVSYQQTTNEINGGVRKIFDRKLYSMRPFVGGGFGYVNTTMDFSGLFSSLQQGNMGIWADGGVYWELERHFNIGVECLYSWAKINYVVAGVTQEANAGGIHAQMILGYHY